MTCISPPIRTSAPVDNLRNFLREVSSSPLTHLLRCAKVSASAGLAGVALKMRHNFPGVGCSEDNWFANSFIVGKYSFRGDNIFPSNPLRNLVFEQALYELIQLEPR